MGLYTPNAQVWYPDTGDTAEINTLLGTQASSIENGLGARLAHQEVAVGCKLGMGSMQLQEAMALCNMQVAATAGCFNNGMTVSATGIVTIQTTGMYLVSGGLGIVNVSGHSVKFEVRKNNASFLYDEVASSSQFWQFCKGSTAVNCVAGDTLALYGADAAATTGVGTINDPLYNHFTVVLIKALPL